jgi:hypothetical protein
LQLITDILKNIYVVDDELYTFVTDIKTSYQEKYKKNNNESYPVHSTRIEKALQ